MSAPDLLTRLIAAFSRLPGVGEKSARRMVYHLLQSPADDARAMSALLAELPEKIHPCPQCHAWTDRDLCPVCADPKRDRGLICVVENASDVDVFERHRLFGGLYHVLGGHLSPLDGVGPDRLNVQSLMDRLEGVREVVLATGSSTEGESTALYLERLLEARGVKATRLARGIPMGTDLEYLDQLTLLRALEARGAP